MKLVVGIWNWLPAPWRSGRVAEGRTLIAIIFTAAVIDALSGGVPLLTGFASLMAGAGHCTAAIAQRTGREAERDAGWGFFSGLFIGALVLFVYSSGWPALF